MKEEEKKGMTVFSKDEYIEQVRKAEHAVGNALPSMGIAHEDGVVLMTGTRVGDSPLMREDNLSSAFMISDNLGMVTSGRVADAQTLADDMRDAAVDEIDTYGRVEDINILVKDIAEEVRNTTQEVVYRPYGVSVLVGGLNGRNESELYRVALDGALTSWSAVAIGNGSEEIMNILESRYDNLDSLESCTELSVQCMVEETNLDAESISAVEITEEDGYRTVTENELQNYLNKGD